MGIWHNTSRGTDLGGGPAVVSCEVQTSDGTWVDVAPGILQPTGGVQLQAAGRQTELTATQPGVMDLTLRNDSGNYTPGLTAAPTSVNLGMPVRLKETIGRRSFDLFAGQLNQPEAVFHGKPHNAEDAVSVTAIDWIGQQQQGRTFVSTLAEHILYNGGSDLTVYYPMGESGLGVRQFGSVAPARPPLPVVPIVSSATDLNDGTAAFQFGSESPIRGDDLRQPLMLPQMTTGSAAIAIAGWYPQVQFATPITVDTGEYLTLAWWATPSTTVHDTSYSIELASVNTDNILDIRRHGLAESPPGAWRARVKDAALTWNITAIGSSMNYGETVLNSVTISSDSLDFFNGARRIAGTVTGLPPASYSFDILTISNFVGSFSHVQIYKGSSAAWSYDKHLAQYQQGLHPLLGGLRRQRTDERLRTLALYAGLTESQLDYDRGVAYMPKAALAGTTWQQQAERAVATEQGRLITAGNGNQRFHNRVNARYNL